MRQLPPSLHWTSSHAFPPLALAILLSRAVGAGVDGDDGRLGPVGMSGLMPPTSRFSCRCVPAPTARSPATLARGEKRLLLYRIDFIDAPGEVLSQEEARRLTDDLARYYGDMSFGRMTFARLGSGSVLTDTLRMPEPSTAYDNQFEKLLAAVREVATAAGYPAASADFDVVFTRAKPWLVYGAMAYVGAPGVWVGNGNFNVGVVGHELGHNLGLPHASFWYTADQSSVGPGVREEYGDPFDSMGVPGGNTSHFNARFKHQLGWLTDAEAPRIEQRGRFTLAAIDDPTSSGLRALRLPRPNGSEGWLEFRAYADNRWVTNGLSLRLATAPAENTLLIDTTPGTPPGKADGAIAVGRTYTDPCSGWQITPWQKTAATPPALEVYVARDPFPNPSSPTLILKPPPGPVTPGTETAFSAEAHHPEGDPLAYHWDFGDGTTGPNEPEVKHAFARAGEYVVRSAVSDGRGNVTSRFVVQTVGEPNTLRLTGTVKEGPRPLEGVLVRAGNLYSYTDSDGAFSIVRLTAGRHSVSAVRDGRIVLNAGFENPVPLSAGVDPSVLRFTALPATAASVALVSTGAVWRYWHAPDPPGPGWYLPEADDSAWASGAAQLGYGVGGETTELPLPPGGVRPGITYFRHPFAIADPAIGEFLILGLRRDDGAVVYLNGSELARENLPAGPLELTTAATADIPSAEGRTFFRRWLAPNLLRPGTNVVAVAVYQAATGTSDLVFDLELRGGTVRADGLLPKLEVLADPAGGGIRVRWPAAFDGWELELSPHLPFGLQATRFPGPPTVSDGWRSIDWPGTSDTPGFFRLTRPPWCGP